MVPPHGFIAEINQRVGEIFFSRKPAQLRGASLQVQFIDPGPTAGFEDPEHLPDPDGRMRPDVETERGDEVVKDPGREG
jgi:hypothetical protein